ncbi:MAG: DNA polymerase III subunit epsilon [Desulfuromonadales bacterium]|nr:DNA polymerase III subunit epsilon [Desulfuromonadales bacterium]
MKKKTSKNDAPLNPLEAEIAVTALHATGNFQVLRRINLEQDIRLTRKTISDPRIGICLDTETTGLDYTTDKIIELGMVVFEYDPVRGEISRILDRYSGFEDPGFPLSPEITEITGITNEMLHGHRFDDDRVVQLANQASVVIAHNAAFDRKFVEARFPVFSRVAWACTVNQINWQAERISTRVLEYLLFKFGWFIHAHRALDDAEGLLGILLEKLPSSGIQVFMSLLETHGKETSKISAVGAPYDKKDLLKQRGYRWSDGAQGGSKAWWISVPTENEENEMAWLAGQVYPGGSTNSIEISRVTPLDRFSIRER